MKCSRSVFSLFAIGTVLVFAGVTLANDWPQWRGPNRDNNVTGFAAPKTWPKELKKQWKIDVGQGESSPVMVGDKLYTFGRIGDEEVTACLDAASGKEIWRDGYDTSAVKGSAVKHAGPRSTPAVAEGKVCTLGVNGTVSCLDAKSGKVIWRKETNSKPVFYTSSSPIIVDGKCIVYVANLTAYDLADGSVKWEWKGGGTPYGSPVFMTVDGVKQIVTPTLGALAGIGLTDGRELWEVKVGPGGNDYQHNYSTPIITGQTVIYTAQPKGKGVGTAAYKIEKKGDGFTATEQWKVALAGDKYHTPVLRDGLLFGVSATGRNYFCMSAADGKELWKDSAKLGECGHILNCGNILLGISSDTFLSVIEPNSKEYKEVAKYKVSDIDGFNGAWACPIIVGNRIYVKDRAALTLWTID